MPGGHWLDFQESSSEPQNNDFFAKANPQFCQVFSKKSNWLITNRSQNITYDGLYHLSQGFKDLVSLQNLSLNLDA